MGVGALVKTPDASPKPMRWWFLHDVGASCLGLPIVDIRDLDALALQH